MTLIPSLARTTTQRIGTNSIITRSMSDTAGPRMHKAKDAWNAIKSTRPPEGHPHNVFEPPYNKATAAIGVISVVSLGYGAMYFGMSHQQKKQGYWK